MQHIFRILRHIYAGCQHLALLAHLNTTLHSVRQHTRCVNTTLHSVRQHTRCVNTTLHWHVKQLQTEMPTSFKRTSRHTRRVESKESGRGTWTWRGIMVSRPSHPWYSSISTFPKSCKPRGVSNLLIYSLHSCTNFVVVLCNESTSRLILAYGVYGMGGMVITHEWG